MGVFVQVFHVFPSVFLAKSMGVNRVVGGSFGGKFGWKWEGEAVRIGMHGG